ncbi:MAG: metallophosphoesterase [Oligoflexia bacterium]|nr:metallophosphoesterase [Oligoflexia bacterium]
MASLAFVSDTQEPIWLERLRLRYDDNAQVTRKIFESIALQSPDAVLHGGDLVAMGSSPGDWEYFRQAFQPLSKLRIPLFATPGNHEFMLSAEAATRHFRRNVPSRSDCQWQTVEIGPIGVILLDSNFSELSKVDVQLQDAGFKSELEYLDRKPEIRFVIVQTHYPPFTNSTVVSESKTVQSRLLPAFFASKKTRLMLSGHAHAYEHFQEGGKDFMVIGGGGGLLHPLRNGPKQKFRDIYPNRRDRGFFHYLTMETRKTGELAVTLMRYDESLKSFASDYSQQFR